jgi:hypothetical protein
LGKLVLCALVETSFSEKDFPQEKQNIKTRLPSVLPFPLFNLYFSHDENTPTPDISPFPRLFQAANLSKAEQALIAEVEKLRFYPKFS